jgi:chromosome segregation ATPase
VQQAAEGQRELQAEFQTGMENVHSERVELRGMQQAIEGHMARLEALAAQLAEVHSTAAATDGDPDRQQQLHELLEDARRQKAAWEQDRCALEAQVELLRGRTVELNETLTEQRHQAAEHQAALASELKRMRSLLEAISGRMQQDGRPGADSKHIPSADEALLDSVLSQFQLLQKDVAQRRVAKHR